MSKAQSKIPSPARSQGALTPRRHRTRRTLSVASPARSDATGRLSSVVEKFIKNDKFTMSPLNRRSVLPDDTEIDAPRRASWWKRLDGSSRDVLEALDTNKMPDDSAMEEYEFEVEKDKQNQTVSESSDNESLASIVVPQRRLFNQKKQPQAKFGDIMGSRKSLGRTNIEDLSVDDAPKNLFNKGPRNKPVFPAALLNSTNKTINKTVEPETNKQTRPNLFGQAGTKRKNVFTDFVVSESEEDSEVQHKAFGFKRNDNKRMSFGTRNRRMPSLTPSMTTEIDIDDWNLLPSSTMIDNAIGVPEVSRIITDQDLELAQEENHDDTLTEENANPETDKIKSIQNKSLNRTKLGKSVTQKHDNDETLTNEDIETEDTSERQKIKDLSKKLNKTHDHSKSVLHDRVKDKTLQNKTSERTVDENEEIIEKVAAEQEQDNVANGPSIEETMAAIHGVSNVQNQESLQKTEAFILQKDKSEEVKTIAEGEINQNQSKQANKTNQDEDMAEILENDKRREEIQLNTEGQKSFQQVNHDKQDDNMADISEKNKTKNEIEQSAGEQEIQNSSKEVSHGNQDEDMIDISEKDKSEKETELSAEEQKIQDSSKEASQENQDETMEDTSEKDQTEEEIEPSAEEQEIRDSSKEASQENQNEDMDYTSEKDESDQEIEESHNSSRETSNENHDEDMEKMVWDDNNDERSNENADRKENGESKQEKRPIRASQSKNVSNKSQEIVEPLVENLQVEEENDVVDETPNNSTHDTTGRNRKKDSTEVKSPEAVLHNITTDNESFRPIGRSTTFRKSKSGIDNINIMHSLAPVQESTIGSEGSRNSSTEGSGWDSHRTTRKTIRQTFGKNYTPRKSLRALVMEQSAKRQTELYNKSTSTMVKNKTEDNERNASKINKTKNKSVLDDVNEHHIRDRRISNPNLTSNELSSSKSRVHGTSTRHMSDPLITEPQVSYHKSFDNINEPEISNREESINISEPANNDSGPEISMHASYGQGMSAEDSDHAISEVHATTNHDNSGKEKTANKSSKELSQRIKSIHVTSDHEILDYEASEKSEEELSEPEEVEHEDSNQDTIQDDSVQELSDQEEEKEDSDPEEFENEVEPEESEQEQNEEESLEEIEHQSEQEESQLETEADSEQEETQQEIDAESVQEESQQEIEAESEEEESQQEIEAESEEEESQQEIEAESEEEESQQEIRAESENEQDHHMSQSVNDISDYESDPENADNSVEPEREIVSDQDENQEDSDNFVSGLNSQYQMSNSNRTERVVFDNEISDQEIDYELSERVSRQITENDISEQMSERQPTPELTKSRVSEHSGAHDVSVGTKKSMVLMQMQKIAQQNMEMRQQIREKVQHSLKPTRNFNFNKMSPIQSKFSIRRINKAEPKKVKSKPKRTGIPVEALPKEFMEDLMYKPPKRFQPANAPWITKRLYKFLETKLEPKYDYRARVRAEELVQSIHSFAKVVRRRDVAPAAAVDELKREMARLHIVNTHFDFYEFFHDFMPREIRVKVNPDVVNKIPMPRNGVFAEILPSRSAVA